LQKKFIKHQDSRYKDFVRYVKTWRDQFQWEPNTKPSSYLLELLALRAYEKTQGDAASLDAAYVSSTIQAHCQQ
jgi:hypothetical protein